jgi:hypothetical protein
MPQDFGDELQRLLNEGRITYGDSQKINLVSFTNHPANFSPSPMLKSRDSRDSSDAGDNIAEITKK